MAPRWVAAASVVTLTPKSTTAPAEYTSSVEAPSKTKVMQRAAPETKSHKRGAAAASAPLAIEAAQRQRVGAQLPVFLHVPPGGVALHCAGTVAKQLSSTRSPLSAVRSTYACISRRAA